MSRAYRQKPARAWGNRTLPAVSAVLPQGRLVELVDARDEDRTGFAVWQDGDWRIMDRVRSAGRILVPYAADNALLVNNVVLFPSKPVDYGSQDQLVEEVRAFIHRYVDVSGAFERLAAYYVCFTCVFDNFNEVPSLRVRGAYGTGKTRFLQTVGSLCYHTIFATAVPTLSPLFPTLHASGGTLNIAFGCASILLE